MHLGLTCEIPILHYGSTILTYKFDKILYSLIQILVICLCPVYTNILILWRTHSGKLVSLAAGDLSQHSEFHIKITAQEKISEMLSSNGPEVNKEQMEEQCNIFLVMLYISNYIQQSM